MILGVDVGYSHTKTVSSKGMDIFKSTVKQGFLDINNCIKVEFEGKEYTIGENIGTISSDLNKIHSLEFKLCLYTAIARAMTLDNEVVSLVTGLPVQYYKSQKSELIRELEGKKITLVLNGKPKHFTIDKSLVFPQSAGLFVLKPNKFTGDTLVVDIGGFTVDSSYFNNMNLQKCKTYELGMNVLHDSLVQRIKAEHKVSYDILRAEEIIKNQSIIKDGELLPIPQLINEVLSEHAELIINRLSAGMSEYSTSKRIFIGGGSVALKDFLPAKNIDEEDIYTNAKAFYTIGVDKFAH